ncbi:MAG TPA: hypothetical protein VFJ02_03900, partial [Vicinamibacterales bacterium]|nr:hypothetical protein [Vicinamibacterales bacterium]
LGAGHPAGWIAGALFGYAATAFALWIPIAIGRPSPWAFTLCWGAIAGLLWVLWRRAGRAQIDTPAWQVSDSAGLAVILALTLALSVPALRRVGEADAAGDHSYRAYFTADFVWHTALTAELSKFAMPPRNPYLASQSIHYYWAYFLLPAVMSADGPAPMRDVQLALKANALLSGVLLMSAVFIAAWAAVGRSLPVTLAVALALVAASAEGTYEIWDLWARGRSLALLRETNIDAVTAWHFQGLRLDGLPRCLWYVPQHSTAYALGLIAIAAAALTGSSGTTGAIALSGAALAGSTMMNPLVGGTFALAWGLAVFASAIRQPGGPRRVLMHGIAAIPVLLAVAWCVAARMVEGAGGVLQFGFFGPARHAPVLSLMLSLGPVIVTAVIGLLFRGPAPLRAVLPAVALSVVALAMMYLVRLRVDQAWVPFRAGQMFLVAVPALAARGIAAAWERRGGPAVAIAGLAGLFAIGLPTTAIDAYNAQDVANHEIGPGFHWTLVLHPEEEAALAWIRTHTPRNALVQMEPTVRDRDQSPGGWGERWSLIPSFAHRRMAAGLPISLMRVPEYSEKSALVKVMYESLDAHEAWVIAHRLHIAYLYVEAIDRDAYPGVAKFDQSPQMFTPVFAQGKAAVYAVR